MAWRCVGSRLALVTNRRQALIALTIVFAALIVPATATAADECTLFVGPPATVHVGESFTVTGSHWDGNKSVHVSIEADPGYAEEAQWPVINGGALYQHVVAKSGQLGWRTITVVGDTTGCESGSAVVVLAAPGTPKTDTVTPTSDVAPGGPAAIFLLLWSIGFGIAATRLRTLDSASDRVTLADPD
jgi:hypothetical protein